MSFKKRLREQPILGGIVIVVLFNAFLLIALLTQMIFYSILGEMHFLTIMWLQFSLMFGFLALLLLYVVPYGLNLPEGVQNFKEYSEAIQLKGKSPFKHNIILGIITVAVFVIFYIITSVFMAEISFDISNLFRFPEPDNMGAFAWIYALRPGIWEEVAFRGVILTMLLKKYSKKTAIILDGILFGMVHFMNLLFGADLISTLIQVAYASILGFFLAFMYIKTESLIPCIITHYLIDVSGQLIFLSGMNIITYLVLLIGVMVIIPVIINTCIIEHYTKIYY